MLYILNFFPENYTTRREEMEGEKKQKHTFTKLDCNKTPNKEKKWKGKQKGTNVLVCGLSTASKNNSVVRIGGLVICGNMYCQLGVHNFGVFFSQTTHTLCCIGHNESLGLTNTETEH